MPESTHTLIAALQHNVAHIEPFVQHYGYLALFAAIFVEGCGIPAPGQTILIASAIMAFHGDLRIEWVMIVSISATFLGNCAGYCIGCSAGRHWFRRLLPGEESLIGIERRLNRWGVLLLVAGRYIEGLKQTLGLISGVSSHGARPISIGKCDSQPLLGGSAGPDSLLGKPTRSPISANQQAI